jgi:hypothetical protein
MNVQIHEVNGKQIAEMLSDGIVIRTVRDAMAIVVEMRSRGLKELILHERNVAPEMLQLPAGVAVEVLNKLTTNQIKVGLVGNFENHKNRLLRAFITESNQGNQVCFTATLESALEKMGSVKVPD